MEESKRLIEATNVGKDIHLLPIREQAEYVDGIVIKMAKDEDFCNSQIKSSRDCGKTGYYVWNNTSIGNCAYISLNGPTQKIRDEYLKELHDYCLWKNTEKVGYWSRWKTVWGMVGAWVGFGLFCYVVVGARRV